MTSGSTPERQRSPSSSSTDTQIQSELRRVWAILDQDAELSNVSDEPEAVDEHDLESAADQGPTVRLATSIVSEAVRSRASDIHVEPQVDGLRIRYRIDGLLRDIMRVPRNSSAALVSRLKIVSGLDIAERRLPQDGRTRLTVDGTGVDARVSTLPSVHGEKVVIRLLASGDHVPAVTQLGLDEQQLEALLAGTANPQGLVLITGPTGSGKTHTLYSVLSHMATPDKNVVTLEDPVEIQLPGITQVQTNERAGLSFSKGLRSILRQDPDVVLVGEVRDSETAELALQASMTGHLVLTTLHTNDAVAALTRLVDMGIQPFLDCVVAEPRRRATARPASVCRLRRAVHAERAGADVARPHRSRPRRRDTDARPRLRRVWRNRLSRPNRNLRGPAGHGERAVRAVAHTHRSCRRRGGARRRNDDTARIGTGPRTTRRDDVRRSAPGFAGRRGRGTPVHSV